MENGNATRVLTRFMKELRLPVTRQSISDELQKHPDYGSLLAFSDVLDNWHIPNAAYSVPHNQLTDVQLPFIAFLANRQFAVVTRLNDMEVTLADGTKKNKVLPIGEFRKMFSGSVLVAEKIMLPAKWITRPNTAGKRWNKCVYRWHLASSSRCLRCCYGALVLHRPLMCP